MSERQIISECVMQPGTGKAIELLKGQILTPIVVIDLPIVLNAEEFAMFSAIKRSDIYGGDDAAALRDLLFSRLEELFLQGHAGAPSIERKLQS